MNKSYNNIIIHLACGVIGATGWQLIRTLQKKYAIRLMNMVKKDYHLE
jgi:hypothetical protein